MKRVFLAFFSSLIPVCILSQENKAFSLTGYVSTMESIQFDSLKGTFIIDNLVHNRLNFKAYAGPNVSFALELRNRLFTGDMVRTGPAYADMIGRDMGWTDLSWNVFSGKSYLFNTTIDRYWLDLNFNKFQARIGRQRINWGQSLVWNPNDIFNAYSFFDFDYIERPGSDAVRLQYYPSFSSAIELAVKSDNNKDITAAALYRFNKWGYDIQFLAAYVNSEDLMAGMGWSGAAGKTSFRGELSWFQPSGSLRDSSATGLFTIGFDRVFVNNSMAQVQFMYCNNPLDLSDFGTFYSGNMSAKDLAFSKFSAFGSFSWAATPLINFGFSSMWFPGLRGFFAGPTTDFSLTDNFDFSLIWQHFRADRIGSSRLRLNLLFLRIKYSF